MLSRYALMLIVLVLALLFFVVQIFSGLVGVASLTFGMLVTVLGYAVTQSYSLL